MSGSACTNFSPECTIKDSFYAYVPSLAVNATFVGIFGFSFAVNVVQGLWWSKAWLGFAIAMLLGNAAEVIGYAGRIINHRNPFDQNGFLIQICCITIAPAFYTAGVYFCLGTIVRICDPSISRIPPRFYAYIFIPCDIISLVVQAIGGAMASIATTELKSPDVGDNIMIAGVSFQVFTLSMFMLLSADYALRVRQSKRANEEKIKSMRMASEKFLKQAVKLNKKLSLEKWNTVNVTVKETRGVDRNRWTKREEQLFHAFIWALTMSTIAIFVRCVYRVVEMSFGWSGVIIANQKLFIGFEGVCVSLAVLILNVLHPGFCLKKPGVNQEEIIPNHTDNRRCTNSHISTDSVDTVEEVKTRSTQKYRASRARSNNLAPQSGVFIPGVPIEEKEEADQAVVKRPISLAEMLNESRLNSIGTTASAEGWLGQNIRDSVMRVSKERDREEYISGEYIPGSRYSSLKSATSTENLGEEGKDGVKAEVETEAQKNLDRYQFV